MYRRIIILSVIIVAALCGLTILGYHAIGKWAQGLEGARLGEFANVAEQIRRDVKRKLDEFIQTEQNRSYSDYQYYYVPDSAMTGQQQMTLLPSPLRGRLEHGLAYGHFQIGPDGKIITPNDDMAQREYAAKLDDELRAKAISNTRNIEDNLLPTLGGTMPRQLAIQLDREAGKGKAFPIERGKALPIESLQRKDQKTQVIKQRRDVVASNVAQTVEPERQRVALDALSERQEQQQDMQGQSQQILVTEVEDKAEQLQQTEDITSANERLSGDTSIQQWQTQPRQAQNEIVEIQIEPFVPIVVGGEDIRQSIFDGQVFLLRHVQIEDRHFLQGFQLNEEKLIEQVKESAERFMREGMTFELAPMQSVDEMSDETSEKIAYTAILDFVGLGNLVLNLKEIDPAWIGKQISQLRSWYFSIVIIVFLAVILGLASLWRNARAQLKLAQKKDDFISAVSHELRTPLTSIRMYSEMLEKNWVKTGEKKSEYYKSMRQESERLSRLIENVLDFSRIQKGRKKYTFKLGDINKCIAEVVEMMVPYAAQNGFSIKTDFQQLGQAVFDSDAVAQIVVNLLDNAIKYARDAEDKTITVRTKASEQFTLIEVEDHGPGVPHWQRKKIFEEFYRTEAEATRETAGTGLGLALVKKFAQAHNGFVEIITAKPSGAIFRVTLSTQM